MSWDKYQYLFEIGGHKVAAFFFFYFLIRHTKEFLSFLLFCFYLAIVLIWLYFDHNEMYFHVMAVDLLVIIVSTFILEINAIVDYYNKLMGKPPKI